MNPDAPIYVSGKGLMKLKDLAPEELISIGIKFPTPDPDLVLENKTTNGEKSSKTELLEGFKTLDISSKIGGSNKKDENMIEEPKKNDKIETKQQLDSKVETKQQLDSKVETKTNEARKVEAKQEQLKKCDKEECNLLNEGNDEILKEHMNIVLIGHVDSGKSTTSGQILLSSGMVNERLVEKYTKEAKENKNADFYLAYITDALEEERIRGVTIEVGRANFETEKKRYTILDAPGHKNYVPNMIMGASQADVAILIISARKGEFEAGFEKNGQTREHIMLARSLGIKTLFVAVNKMDECEWKIDRFNEISTKIKPYLKIFRYGDKDTLFIPVASLHGINIKSRVSPEVCAWYKGGSLLEELDNLPYMKRNDSGPLRLPILDRYKDMGLTVLGKVEQGVLQKGNQYILVPGGHSLEVSEIQDEGKNLQRAFAGENVQFVVKGIEDFSVHRGDVICEVNNALKCYSEFVGTLSLIRLPPEKVQIWSANSSAVIHIHTAVSDVRVVKILTELDKKGEIITKLPKYIKVGTNTQIHFRLPTAIPMETFKDSPQMGRFVLRDEDITIGYGKIIHLGPPIRKPKATQIDN